jgi:lysophospholipase L1-like esterase
MLRKLALPVAAVAVTLGALELGIRAGGLELHNLMLEYGKYVSLLVEDTTGGYLRHPARSSVVLHGSPVRFNSLGMRDEEPRVPKPPGTVRVLCIGDSMVLGLGARQDRIFPARMRELLAADGIDVVAAGVGGWDTVEEERFLAANLDRLAPDVIALLYYGNDNESLDPIRRAHQAPSGWTDRLYRTLVLRSRLFEWGAYVYRTRVAPVDWAALRQLNQWRREKAAREAVQPAFAPDEPGWLRSRAALARVLELTRAHGAGLVIYLYNVGNLPPGPTALARLREFGAETGVPVFDTLPFFGDEPFDALIVAPPDDVHPSERGHELLAGGIVRTLRAEGLLRPAAQRRAAAASH